MYIENTASHLEHKMGSFFLQKPDRHSIQGGCYLRGFPPLKGYEKPQVYFVNSFRGSSVTQLSSKGQPWDSQFLESRSSRKLTRCLSVPLAAEGSQEPSFLLPTCRGTPDSIHGRWGQRAFGKGLSKPYSFEFQMPIVKCHCGKTKA